jgi:DNA polymerase III epsilon subunit-like protein
MTDVHCMTDLETLSTRTNARIVSIGAVLFNEDGIYAQYYRAIKNPSLARLPHITSVFHVCPRTLKWWEQQSPEAQAVFSDPDAFHIVDALHEFTAWIKKYDSNDTVRMWGNGASFDNAILATAYDLLGLQTPWAFFNDRCYRTVKNLYPDVPMERCGTHHNALDDARSQAQHLLAMGVSLR